MKSDIFNPFEDLGKTRADLEDIPESAELERPELLEERPSFWIWIFFTLSLLVFLIFAYRLAFLQIRLGSKSRLLAESNRLRSQVIQAPRGEILDRNSKILATNEPSFRLEILPFDMPKAQQEREVIYQKVSQVTKIPLEEITRVEEENLRSIEPVVVASDLERETALRYKLQLADLSAVSVVGFPKRIYHGSEAFAHLVGYVGPLTPKEIDQHPGYPLSSLIGKTALELIFDQKLRGKEGERQVEIDSQGKLQRILATRPPQIGQTLVTSIDADLQEKAAQSLASMVQKSSGRAGAVIVLAPQTGEILALVSLPSFDHQAISSGLSQAQFQKLIEDTKTPLLNRVTSGLYPPGSSIKPFLAVSALEEGTVNPRLSFDTPPSIKIGEFVFPDWKDHGVTDIKRAIAESNNIFFYGVAGGFGPIRGLGPDKIKSYLEKFGFGSPTQINLPAEETGFLPDSAWKEKEKGERWYVGDSYNLGIGQGDLLITPLQEAIATALIANGGELLKPRLVKAIVDENGQVVEETKKEVLGRFGSSSNLQVVKDGMRQTITSGSAQQLMDLPIEVAGKTGTAQFGQGGKTHAWFTSFAPYREPQIVVTVFIEGGGEGYATAAPVAKEIYKFWAAKQG